MKAIVRTLHSRPLSLWALLLIALVALSLRHVWRSSGGAAGAVLRVIDGDTLVVQTSSGPAKVRVIGIDTPECFPGAKLTRDSLDLGMSEERLLHWGQTSTTYAREQLGGRRVRLVAGDGAERDRYGRLLAYVEPPGGRDYGLDAIMAGMAVHYDRYPHPRSGPYDQAEKQARQQGRGLWAELAASSPEVLAATAH